MYELKLFGQMLLLALVFIGGLDNLVWAKALEEPTSMKSILKKVRPFHGEHAVCYLDTGEKNAQVKGVNIDRQVRLASVTKILTSYWAISNLGPHYRFKTKFYWDSTAGELLIEGSKDPYFGLRRMFLLISDLNRMGIHQINKVYFDTSFHYFQGVENSSTYHTEIDQRGGIARPLIARQLLKLMNTREWGKKESKQYREFTKTADGMGVSVIPGSDLDLKVLDVEPAERGSFRGRRGVDTYTSESPYLVNYLKVMNMYSMNYPADELFNLSGGRQSFSDFLTRKLKISPAEAQVFTGSGLPYKANAGRSDTTTSCDTMIDVLLELKNELAKSMLDLPDIMMVGGVDQGTTYPLYAKSSLKGAVVAKTGTIDNAIALSGFINTKDGRVYFGIFFATRNPGKARVARNQLVQKLALENGGSVPLAYTKGFRFVAFAPQSVLRLDVPQLVGLP